MILSYFHALGLLQNIFQSKTWLEKKILIELNPIDHLFSEVLVKPQNWERKILGIKKKSTTMQIGFEDSLLGFECGRAFKNHKVLLLKKVNIFVTHNTFDTVFCRMNLYHFSRGKPGKNLLKEPLYVTIHKDSLGEKLSIDLRQHDIRVNESFLITLENIKFLGKGSLYFSASFLGKTYLRETSQAKWNTFPISLGMNVEVLQKN